MCLVSGFSGEHPVPLIEAAAVAPYPLAADLQLNGVWLSDASDQVVIGMQKYDFSCAELTTEFEFRVRDIRCAAKVITF